MVLSYVLVAMFLMKISLYSSRVTKRNNLRLNTWGEIGGAGRGINLLKLFTLAKLEAD